MHMLIHSFCVENTGKVETGRAIGFKGEENNSVISLTLIREDFRKDMGSSISMKVKAFITKGD